MAHKRMFNLIVLTGLCMALAPVYADDNAAVTDNAVQSVFEDAIAKQIDAVVAEADQKDVPVMLTSLVVSPENIAYYTSQAKVHVSRQKKMQTLIKILMGAGAAYSAYYIGSGIFNWYMGKSAQVATQAVAHTIINPLEHSDRIAKLETEFTTLKELVPQTGFWMGQLKYVGQIFVASYCMGGLNKVTTFASQSLYEAQLRGRYNQYCAILEILEKATEAMMTSEHQQVIFDENHAIIEPLCKYLKDRVELLISACQLVIENTDAADVAEYKLDSIPSYLILVHNKVFSEIVEKLVILQKGYDHQALGDIKAQIELCHAEVRTAWQRLVLVLQAEAKA